MPFFPDSGWGLAYLAGLLLFCDGHMDLAITGRAAGGNPHGPALAHAQGH